MVKIRIILSFILFFSLSVRSQLPPEFRRAVDSIQKIIKSSKNDTMVIFQECGKQAYLIWYEPSQTCETFAKLLGKAKTLNHPASVTRCYNVYAHALEQIAVREKDPVKKEKILARADSILSEEQAFIIRSFKGSNLCAYYYEPTNLYRILGHTSISKKEYYYNKEIEGDLLMLNKYGLRKYPNQFLHTIFGLAVGLQNQLRSDAAAKYYLMLSEYSDSLKRYDRASEFYNNLGFTYYADGNLGMAQRYYFLSLKCTEKLPPDSFTVTDVHKDRIGNKGVTMSNIANVFNLQKNYQQSVDYYKKSIPYFIDAKANDIYISIVFRIGTIYAVMGQIDSAEAYLKKSQKLTSLLNGKEQLTMHEIRLSNLKGSILAQKKQYRDAIAVAQDAVRLSEQTGNTQVMNQTYELIGTYYVLNGEPKRAIEYYNKQLTLKDRGGWYEKTLSKIHINKAKAFLKMNRADSAIANLLIAKELAEKVNVKLEMNSVYENLADAYIQANDMANAVSYLKKHIQYKDSLTGDQVIQQITSTALKYEEDLKLMAEKNIREKERMESEKKSEEEAQQRRVLMIIIFSVSLLVVVAGISLLKIRKANTLLKSQKTEIEEQRNLVMHQKNIVVEKNKEITDSILYAKRIQTALIHTQPHLTGSFKDHFIFFKPKDIVSGDFYWSAIQNEHVYIAACDCTGHGVPGAFMSLLNISFLNEAINQKKLIEPNKVFDFVRTNLVSSLSSDESKDGMDACLLHLNKKTQTLTYSAANNKPVIVRNNEVIELGCDKMPVGKSHTENEFTLYTVNYQTDDVLYLFTDGYKDQFGGKENKKLNSKMFKKLLLESSGMEFAMQKENIKQFFNEWKGEAEQTDDVCVIGLKL